jgi:hypothetical protein
MPSTESLTERLRAFAHMVIEGDHNVRNHLSVTGSTADVATFLKHARVVEDGQTVLVLGDRHLPVAYQERRHRAHAGAWVTIEPGKEPQAGSTRMEEAEAVFSFASDAAFDGELAPLSEEHPRLEFRYAWFEHRGEQDDVARGGLWKGGRRLAEHIGQLQDTPPDTQQLAGLIRSVEALEEPVAAIAPAG